MGCGNIGCCDDSPNRHASKHAHEISHPIIRSAEPGEDWSWCYIAQVHPATADLQALLTPLDRNR